MGAYNIINPSHLQAGQLEDVGDVLANLQAIQTILNGGIDNSNVSALAAIAASKFAGYPADIGQVLRGDGSWAKGLSRIDQQVLGADSPVVSFTPVFNTFSHLALFWQAGNSSGLTQELRCQVNGITTVSYLYEVIATVNGASAPGGAASTAAKTSFSSVGYVGNGGGGTGAGVIFFPGYNANFSTKRFFGVGVSGASDVRIFAMGCGIDLGAAINRIDLFSGAGNITQNSIFTLYGLG